MILNGIVDRLEENYAIILLRGGYRVDWPIDALPDDLGEGDAIKFAINENSRDTENREEITKTLLNQILSGGHIENKL